MQMQFKKTIINSIQKNKKGPRFLRRIASTRKRVASWVAIPDGVGVDRGFKRGGGRVLLPIRKQL